MDFAFLIHSRDYRDVQRKFKIAKYIPKSWVEFWCLHWPPVVVSEITGMNSRGWIVGIPMTAEQMLENRELALDKIFKAISKAEKLGAQIVGLGALTASLTNGGLDLINKVGPKITTGNALTAAVSVKHIQEILVKNEGIETIAIVGGTGSIGSAISKILLKDLPEKKYIIFARTPKNLTNLIKELKQISSSARVQGYANNLQNLSAADLVIVATSSSEALVKTQHLKQGAIVYDMSQPQNVDRATIKSRTDVKFYDGGLVEVAGLEKKLPLGLPPKTIFACLGETMLLAMEEYQDNFSLGKSEIGKVYRIYKLARKRNFAPAQLKRIRI